MAEPCERSFHVIMYFMPFSPFQSCWKPDLSPIVLTKKGATDAVREPSHAEAVLCSKPFAVKSRSNGVAFKDRAAQRADNRDNGSLMPIYIPR